MALSLADMERLDREATSSAPGTPPPASTPAPGLSLADMERLDREASSGEGSMVTRIPRAFASGAASLARRVNDGTAFEPLQDPDVAERLRQFNRGILDLPEGALRAGDLAAAPAVNTLNEITPPGLRRLGGQEGSADRLTRMAREVGVIPLEGQEEPDFLARVLRTGGASVVPSVAAAAKARSALGAAGVLAREGVSVLGAAGGGKVAENLVGGDSLAARAIGELIGGFAAPMAVSGGVPLAARAARNTLDAIYDPARPARRLQSVVADPSTSAARVEAPLDPTMEPLSPAQRTGDVGALSLEATAAKDDPALAARLADQRAAASEAAREAGRFGGDPGAPMRFLEETLSKAGQRAQRVLRRLAPATDPKVAAERTRVIIEGALKQARGEEDRLYAALPKNRTVMPKRAVQRYQEILADRTEVHDPSDLPDFVRRFLGDLDEEGAFVPGPLAEGTDFRRAHVLRSRLLDAAREERGATAPNRNKLRILGELQEALLDDLDEAADGAFREATAFSRELNDRFTRGAVGELLSFDTRGGQRTAPAETLERALGGRGQAQAQQFRELVAAAPETRPLVEDHLKASFAASAVDSRTNVVARPRAERFLQRNAGVLEELPELRNQLRRAMTTQGRVDELLGVPQADALTPLVRRKSAAGLYLNGNPDDAMERVLNTGRPALARSLVREVSADPSGEALSGLKAAYVDALYRRARGTTNDVRGMPEISGAQLRQALADTEGFAAAILSPVERRRLDRITQTFELVDRARRATPRTEGLISDMPNTGLAFLVRISSTELARKAVNTLQALNFISTQTRERLIRLTNDPARRVLIEAVEDPTLYAALLRRVDQMTPRTWGVIESALRPYLAIPAATAGREEEEGPTARNEDDRRWVSGILQQHAEVPFIKRILRPEAYGSLEEPDGRRATHKMAWSEVDGRFLVYPTIVESGGGLRQLEDDEALDNAIATGNLVAFPTAQEADRFSRRYKVVWGDRSEAP